MKFRDEDNLEPLIVADGDPKQLQQFIKELSDKYDFIDLQYSTTLVDPGSGNWPTPLIQYSALILGRLKENKDEKV